MLASSENKDNDPEMLNSLLSLLVPSYLSPTLCLPSYASALVNKVQSITGNP